MVTLILGKGTNLITLNTGHSGANVLDFPTILTGNANTAPFTADKITNFLRDTGAAQGDTITLGFAAANIITSADANSAGDSLWVVTNGMMAKTGASVLNFINDVQSITQAGGVAATSGIAGFSDGTNTWIAYNDHANGVAVIELVGIVAAGIEAGASLTNNYVHIA